MPVTYAGTGGGDTVDFPSDAISFGVQVFGSGPGLLVDGLGANDSLVGSGFASAAETLLGGEGDDTVIGSNGAVFIRGGAGADLLAISGRGTGEVRGGAGNDTIRVTDAALGATVGGADSWVRRIVIDGGADADTVVFAGRIGLFTRLGLNGVEVLDVGAATLVGTTVADLYDFAPFAATSGDVLTLLAGEGADTVRGFAATAVNALRGEGGSDSLVGGGIGDNLSGGTGADSAEGRGGDDTLDGGSGADLLRGGAGNDTLAGGETGAQAGDDTLDGGAGEDRLDGSGGDDLLRGGDDLDDMAGGDGADSLDGGNAGDNMRGDGGADSLFGGAGDDSMFAGDDADTLDGGADNDGLDGNGGNDLLRGGAGNDVLLGGAGSDTLIGGAGVDLLIGAGTEPGVRDLVSYAGATGAVSVLLNLEGNATGAGVSGENDVILGANALLGSDFADTLRGPDLAGGKGADLLSGLAGADTIRGGQGADTLDGAEGPDLLIGGAGNDLHVVDDLLDTTTETDTGPGAIDTVLATITWSLGANLERLILDGTAGLAGTGNASANRVAGNAGANSLAGLGGADTLSGGAGNDTLRGGDGADSLVGGGDADLLMGGRDGDTLAGGLGNDVLDGGQGRDAFRFADAQQGTDLIQGYVVADDVIEVSASGFGGGLAVAASLAPARFALGAAGAATDGAQRFIWDDAAKSLWFDVDGNGAQAAVAIATFSGSVTLTEAEIRVIA